MFVVTNIFCDKSFVTTKYFCRDKSFVMTSILLSQQKMCFMTNICLSDKTLVATKMILVAVPASDRAGGKKWEAKTG